LIALAALLAEGPPSAPALARLPEPQAALALLSGRRPKRLAPPETILGWAAEATGTSPALLAASLQASGDRCEVAALLLPSATGPVPSLSECLAALETLSTAPEDQRRTGFLTLAARLPNPARLHLTRLATGSFRQTLKPDAPATGGPRRALTLLTMIAPQGPEGSFALRHGNGLVPLAKLPLALPETPQILTWARANVTERFGPNLALTPSLVFEISCEGTTPNTRRKSGLDLVAPRLLSWLPDATPDQATTLDAFLTL
jgi:hypothetical protein